MYMVRIFLGIILFALMFQGVVFGEPPAVLHAGVSLVKEVTPALMGTWRV